MAALPYAFEAKKTTENIVKWIADWFLQNGPDCNAVIGISGGKDSSVVAALCAKALGPQRVVGLLMPNGIQDDIDMARLLVEHVGIRNFTVNIGATFGELKQEILKNFEEEGKGVIFSDQSQINLPARLRMSALYALSQSLNGRVANTCNLSEDWVGYSTRYGDAAGDFSPLGNLTVGEILEVGRSLGLPDVLVDKLPADGLSGQSDEERLGFSYAVLDRYIRTGKIEDATLKERIDDLHRKSRFKYEPLPVFPYKNS